MQYKTGLQPPTSVILHIVRFKMSSDVIRYPRFSLVPLLLPLCQKKLKILKLYTCLMVSDAKPGAVGVQGEGGFCTPPSSVKHPLEKFRTTLKNLLDHAFSAFRIAEPLLLARVDFFKRFKIDL